MKQVGLVKTNQIKKALMNITKTGEEETNKNITYSVQI